MIGAISYEVSPWNYDLVLKSLLIYFNLYVSVIIMAMDYKNNLTEVLKTLIKYTADL